MEKLVLLVILNSANGVTGIEKFQTENQMACLKAMSAIISDTSNVIVGEDELDYIYNRSANCVTISEAQKIR